MGSRLARSSAAADQVAGDPARAERPAPAAGRALVPRAQLASVMVTVLAPEEVAVTVWVVEL